MNTKTLLLLVLSAALLPFAAQAKPDGAPASEKGKKGPPPPEQVIERLDADGNGTISQEEVKGPLTKHFAKIDTNGDGQIDLEELSIAHEKRAASAKEKGNRLKEADTDGNGSISFDEASAAEMVKMVEHFDKIDADGDGEVSKQEMRAMRKQMERRGPPAAE